MKTTDYGWSKVVAMPFAEAVASAREAFAHEGFGQLTEVDVRAKMREKVNADMEPYLILGMCHPQLAYRALQAETEIGLLLPCNVIVYEKDTVVRVAAERPSLMAQIVRTEALQAVSNEAEKHILAALDAIA